MDLDYFREIVSGDALTSNGMPQFKDLSDQELKDIHEYIREQTKSAEPVVR
jgi:cytochrome c1|tara:strand:- start:308 stop:460 length:153 start_codon:yes stop_codon:yes gene_type:complete